MIDRKSTLLGKMGKDIRVTYKPNREISLPYIGYEHIDQQTLSLVGIGKSNEVQSDKKKFKSGDIIFGTLRPYFRKVIIPNFDGVCSTDLAVIRAKEEYDQKFLFYVLASQALIDFANVSSNGTKMPRAKWDVLAKTEWLVPSLSDQQLIGSILSAYDELIEVNNQRIKVLEETARELYKEWFVRMRFPGYKKAKFEKGIPGGWEMKKVKELLDRQKFGKTYRPEELQVSGNVIVIDQSTDELLGYHNNEPAHIASTSNPMIIFGDHTCKIQLLVEPFSLAENVIPVSSKDDIQTCFLYYLIESLVETSEYKRHWNELISKLVIVPTEDLQIQYSDFVKPLIEQIFNLRKQNTQLRQIRDRLLPRLISGKLQVKTETAELVCQ